MIASWGMRPPTANGQNTRAPRKARQDQSAGEGRYRAAAAYGQEQGDYRSSAALCQRKVDHPRSTTDAEICVDACEYQAGDEGPPEKQLLLCPSFPYFAPLFLIARNQHSVVTTA
jgi:hypothetical protein